MLLRFMINDLNDRKHSTANILGRFSSVTSGGESDIHMLMTFNVDFVEREDSVKCDVFNAYRALLRQTRPITTTTYDSDAMEEENR